MLKIAILYPNKMVRLTQWGHPSDTCEKLFVTDANSFNELVPQADCAMIIHRFDMDLVKSIKKPIVFFYGDYRPELNYQTLTLMSMAKIVLTTWYREDIYSEFNAFAVRQGVNPDIWKPIPGCPEEHDVVFSGNNHGSDLRLNILEKLNNDFNLFIVGRNWPSYFNSTNKKTPLATNKFLNRGKVNVGIFNKRDNSNVKFLTSNRLYQGMACGKPHIGPHTIGLRSYFRPDDCYMDYTNYKDLKKTINKLLKNKKLRTNAAKAQRAAIVRENTVWHAWKRMETIIANNI